jgi:hypothetical protein
MIGSKRCLFAAILSLAYIAGVNGQARLPPPEPEVARELFGTYAACRAYWKEMTQCLPSGLAPKDYAQVRKSFDLRWSRLFGQFFRFDKWNPCRG